MAGQRIGYVRVSTFDQNPERQLDSTPVDRTFTDKASGKDAKRPQLEDMMSFARTGDTVVVHSMDRLARNLDDLRRIVQTLTRRGVRVEFVKEHLVFTGEDSPMANLMLSVMGLSRNSSVRCSGYVSARASHWPGSAAFTVDARNRCPILKSLNSAAGSMKATRKRSSRATSG